jgi:hypothetical protein
LKWILLILSSCLLSEQSWAQPDALSCDHLIDRLKVQLYAGQVSLSWLGTSALPEGAYFSIERSADGKPFESIGSVKLLAKSVAYQFTDQQPLGGNSLYRIHYRDPYLTCSTAPEPVFVPSSVGCKFYPNPVQNNLLIKTDQAGRVELYDAAGQLRLTSPVLAGANAVDVSSLPKGKYLIHVISVERNRIFSDFLVKQ